MVKRLWIPQDVGNSPYAWVGVSAAIEASLAHAQVRKMGEVDTC